MPGSFRIARIAGIPIRVHFSFLLVLPLLAVLFGRVFAEAARLAGVAPGMPGLTPFVWGFLLAVALFLSVLVHELSHALYARRSGAEVRDVTLLMIGGVTQMTDAPKRSRDEAVMAAVGPLTSVVLGTVCLLLHRLFEPVSFDLAFGLFYLGNLNLLLGAFNLLPAFPMDGGRVLRAVLTPRLGSVRATRIASAVGRGFAVLFGLFGLLTFNLFLLLIAYFVYVGAGAEGRQIAVKEVLSRLKVRDLMHPSPPSLPSGASVLEAAGQLVSTRRLSAPVVEDGRVVGVFGVRQVERVPEPERAARRVGQAMASVDPLEADLDAWLGLRRIVDSGLSELPVVDGGQLVGSLSQEDLLRGVELARLRDERRGRIGPPIRV